LHKNSSHHIYIEQDIYIDHSTIILSGLAANS